MTASHPSTKKVICPICTVNELADGEEECSECRNGRDAYCAFQETEPCKRCGEGESWTVKGPGGVCIGQSWTGDEAACNAEEAAQALNAAYEAGRQSALLPVKQPANLDKYQLEVGITPDGREVIVNHPEMEPSPNERGGHIVFSPQQARDFAALMFRKAGECL